MAQNVYDDATFFEAYAGLERSVQGLAGAAEWPRLRGLLPALAGLRVVDLGCGYGWFGRFARGEGAAEVLGIDLSERMLARAAALGDDPGITYRRLDLNALELPAHRFELAFSSLALHYVEDLPRLLSAVAGALTPGGRFVFSVEHPVYTAPPSPRWSARADGGETWLLDHYLDEGRREVEWLGARVVKQHRTLATYLSALAAVGLRAERLEEFGPSPEQLAVHPEWSRERERPMFLLVGAVSTDPAPPGPGSAARGR